MGEFYGRVLARVHDEGYTAFARAAARDVQHHLSAHATLAPHVIDAGCGSGALAAVLPEATVWGVDVSGDMLDLARAAAPHATFVQCDILDVALWPCSVVCAVGEVFNYALADRDDEGALWAFFRRVFDVLPPGGLLLFDVAHPGRHEGQTVSQQHGALKVTMTPRNNGAAQNVLTRDIIVAGPDDIGIHETHRLRLLRHDDVETELIDAGFRVHVKDHYSQVALRAHWSVYVAVKPAG